MNVQKNSGLYPDFQICLVGSTGGMVNTSLTKFVKNRKYKVYVQYLSVKGSALKNVEEIFVSLDFPIEPPTYFVDGHVSYCLQVIKGGQENVQVLNDSKKATEYTIDFNTCGYPISFQAFDRKGHYIHNLNICMLLCLKEVE